MNTRDLMGRLGRVFSVSHGTRTRPRRRNRLGTIARLELLEARTLLASVSLAQLTDSVDVVSGNPSISGDGTRIAFESRGNLTGSNVDGNSEIFLFDTTSSSFTQITNTAGPSISSYAPQISGDGAVIAFESGADFTGGNTDGNSEIFVFNTITGAITQVTDSTRGGGNVLGSVSGNGGAIVFTSDADLTGGNIDRNREVFLFDASTSALTQVTDTTNGFNLYSSISSDGMIVAFESVANLTGNNTDGNSEIFVFNVATGTVTQVTDTTEVHHENPSLDGDGSRIAFVSQNDIALLDVSSSTLTLVTDNADNYNPAINADGTKIAFTRGFTESIFLFDATTGSLSQITEEARGVDGPSINSDGTKIAFWSGFYPPFGDEGGEITLFDTTTSSFTYVTRTVLQASNSASISSDGTKLAFQSTADLTGNNADRSHEVFLFDTTTDTFIQVTESTHHSPDARPAISGDGTKVVFHSPADLTGNNADGSDEIFLFDAVTSTLTQVTDSVDGTSWYPAINSDGTRMTFTSNADLTGGNPDGNVELLLFDSAAESFTQVTATVGAQSGGSSISADGTKIAFSSNADLTGDNSAAVSEVFIFDATSGSLTQVSKHRYVGDHSGEASISSDGTRLAFSTYSNYSGNHVSLYDISADSIIRTIGRGSNPSIDGDGTKVAFESASDLNGSNPDNNYEIFVFDTTNGILTQMTVGTSRTGNQYGSNGASVSVDGAKIAFHSAAQLADQNQDGNSEVFLATIDYTFVVGVPGDYDGSGETDQGDMDLVLENWGSPSAPVPNNWVNDLPRDVVDQDELDGVLINWGATSTPEAQTAQQAVTASQPIRESGTHSWLVMASDPQGLSDGLAGEGGTTDGLLAASSGRSSLRLSAANVAALDIAVPRELSVSAATGTGTTRGWRMGNGDHMGLGGIRPVPGDSPHERFASHRGAFEDAPHRFQEPAFRAVSEAARLAAIQGMQRHSRTAWYADGGVETAVLDCIFARMGGPDAGRELQG